MILGGMSVHFNEAAREYLNQQHEAIGVRIDDFSATYVHNNSYDDPSFYIDWTPTIPHTETKYFEAHGILGIATGYDNEKHVIDDQGNYFQNREGVMIGDEYIMPMIGVGVTATAFGHYQVNIDLTPDCCYVFQSATSSKT